MTTGLRNWSGNHAFGGMQLHEPNSLDVLRSFVARADKVHVLGTRHSFNDIADSTELISLNKLDQSVVVDRETMSVSIPANMTYAALANTLQGEGLALHNMASLPHISVGGAVATATHGSGNRSGNLSTAVTSMELVTSDGDVLTITRGEADFPGAVVHVGALGAVTRITLAVEPDYKMRQYVHEHLPWESLLGQFDAVMSSADSVSIFTAYGDDAGQLWCKSRVMETGIEPWPDNLFGAAAATTMTHPVPGASTENLTTQLGEIGAWADRLPHFRPDAIPASGNELQAEYMVARGDAVDALQAIRKLAPVIQPHLLVSEIRTVASDDFWLSSAYGRDTVCLHFSWKNDLGLVLSVLPHIESALAPFSPRPHWGKLFTLSAKDLAPRFPRHANFIALAHRLDPRGAFRNAFLERHVFG